MRENDVVTFECPFDGIIEAVVIGFIHDPLQRREPKAHVEAANGQRYGLPFSEILTVKHVPLPGTQLTLF
jgi:hypothetical protein